MTFDCLTKKKDFTHPFRLHSINLLNCQYFYNQKKKQQNQNHIIDFFD